MLLKTPDAELGSLAPSFLLPDTDGQAVDLKTAMGPKGLVVAFICNHCPYVKAIVTELVSDAKELKKEGVHFVAIMPNDYQSYPADNPQQMKHFSEHNGFEFPYLLDETQDVARAYGAVCTPDFFGYDSDARLRYRGRLDNGNVQRPKVRVAELVDAMKGVAADGAGPKEQSASVGCSIKWR